MKDSITADEFGRAWVKERKAFEKALKNVLWKRWGYALKHEDFEDLVLDALIARLKKIEEGTVYFEDTNASMAYLMRCCIWNNTRNHTKLKLDTVSMDAIDLSNLPDTPTLEMTEQDERDAEVAGAYVKVFELLEEALVEKRFTFREIGLFKSYLINGHCIRTLVEESGWSRTTCSNAVRAVKLYIKANL